VSDGGEEEADLACGDDQAGGMNADADGVRGAEAVGDEDMSSVCAVKKRCSPASVRTTPRAAVV
jgi:hypothetical protein